LHARRVAGGEQVVHGRAAAGLLGGPAGIGGGEAQGALAVAGVGRAAHEARDLVP